jgi:hypothetical protein
MNPKFRIKAADALNHPYFDSVRGGLTYEPVFIDTTLFQPPTTTHHHSLLQPKLSNPQSPTQPGLPQFAAMIHPLHPLYSPRKAADHQLYQSQLHQIRHQQKQQFHIEQRLLYKLHLEHLILAQQRLAVEQKLCHQENLSSIQQYYSQKRSSRSSKDDNDDDNDDDIQNPQRALTPQILASLGKTVRGLNDRLATAHADDSHLLLTHFTYLINTFLYFLPLFIHPISQNPTTPGFIPYDSFHPFSVNHIFAINLAQHHFELDPSSHEKLFRLIDQQLQLSLPIASIQARQQEEMVWFQQQFTTNFPYISFDWNIPHFSSRLVLDLPTTPTNPALNRENLSTSALDQITLDLNQPTIANLDATPTQPPFNTENDLSEFLLSVGDLLQDCKDENDEMNISPNTVWTEFGQVQVVMPKFTDLIPDDAVPSQPPIIHYPSDEYETNYDFENINPQLVRNQDHVLKKKLKQFIQLPDPIPQNDRIVQHCYHLQLVTDPTLPQLSTITPLDELGDGNPQSIDSPLRAGQNVLSGSNIVENQIVDTLLAHDPNEGENNIDLTFTDPNPANDTLTPTNIRDHLATSTTANATTEGISAPTRLWSSITASIATELTDQPPIHNNNNNHSNSNNQQQICEPKSRVESHIPSKTRSSRFKSSRDSALSCSPHAILLPHQSPPPLKHLPRPYDDDPMSLPYDDEPMSLQYDNEPIPRAFREEQLMKQQSLYDLELCSESGETHRSSQENGPPPDVDIPPRLIYPPSIHDILSGQKELPPLVEVQIFLGYKEELQITTHFGNRSVSDPLFIPDLVAATSLPLTTLAAAMSVESQVEVSQILSRHERSNALAEASPNTTTATSTQSPKNNIPSTVSPYVITSQPSQRPLGVESQLTSSPILGPSQTPQISAQRTFSSIAGVPTTPWKGLRSSFDHRFAHHHSQQEPTRIRSRSFIDVSIHADQDTSDVALSDVEIDSNQDIQSAQEERRNYRSRRTQRTQSRIEDDSDVGPCGRAYRRAFGGGGDDYRSELAFTRLNRLSAKSSDELTRASDEFFRPGDDTDHEESISQTGTNLLQHSNQLSQSRSDRLESHLSQECDLPRRTTQSSLNTHEDTSSSALSPRWTTALVPGTTTQPCPSSSLQTIFEPSATPQPALSPKSQANFLSFRK